MYLDYDLTILIKDLNSHLKVNFEILADFVKKIMKLKLNQLSFLVDLVLDLSLDFSH